LVMYLPIELQSIISPKNLIN
jgi:hypothetical protein